jgi:hypothetical protein
VGPESDKGAPTPPQEGTVEKGQIVVMDNLQGSLENARRFANAADLREAMQRAGVADQPDVYFLEEVEQLQA